MTENTGLSGDWNYRKLFQFFPPANQRLVILGIKKVGSGFGGTERGLTFALPIERKGSSLGGGSESSEVEGNGCRGKKLQKRFGGTENLPTFALPNKTGKFFGRETEAEAGLFWTGKTGDGKKSRK